MRVLTVVGARPQFIKAAPVSKLLRREHEECLVHTGQHYDDAMSDLFFRQLSIPAPDVNLGVGSASHGAQTGAMLPGIEEIALDYRPDRLLVYGDTNSTLAGALVGAKLHIPVAHVEAGLRSFDRRMPEEVNRVVADHLSSFLFSPTATGVENLRREGITEGVELTGDVMLDAFRQHLELAPASARGDYILMTIHRAENTDSQPRLGAILQGAGDSGLRVVLPMHPRTKAVLAASEIKVPSNVQVIEPVGYLEMLALEADAEAIATDSGGVQKEAYFSGRPCITLRDTTEWPETVDAGWNVLVGADPQRIASAMREFRPSGSRPELFGDGRAAQRVVDSLTT